MTSLFTDRVGSISFLTLKETPKSEAPSTRAKGRAIGLFQAMTSAGPSCLSLWVKAYPNIFFLFETSSAIKNNFLKAVILKTLVTYAFPSQRAEVLTSLDYKFY